MDTSADQKRVTTRADQPRIHTPRGSQARMVDTRAAIERSSDLWTPAQLGSDLALWLDFWDSPFQLRTDGGTDYVEEWGDLSGNGNDAVQGTGAAQPVFGNGVEFDGSNDYLRSNFSPGISPPIAKISLSDADGNTKGAQWSTSDNTFNDGSINLRKHQGEEESALFTNSNYKPINSPGQSGPRIQGGQFQSGGKWDLRVNGAIKGSRDSGEPLVNPLTVSTIGGLIRDSGNNIGVSPGDFWVCVLVNADLSQSQWDKLTGWLAHKADRKSGISEPLANLPSDHPYKSDPPRI